LLLSLTTQIHGVDNRDVLGSLTAGAAGAFVSVMARIGSGQFRLDYDVGRRYPIFMGGLRPLIGAIFGLALYFAVTSSLLDVFKLPTNDNQCFYFLLVIALLAGFSERWARDTLLSFGGASAAPSSAPPKGTTARESA
jgi:ABC-type branched-subunit amino acid transport system permease subunit